MGGIVLVVEDDVDLIGIYKEILELHDFDVETSMQMEKKESKNSLIDKTISRNHGWRYANS